MVCEAVSLIADGRGWDGGFAAVRKKRNSGFAAKENCGYAAYNKELKHPARRIRPARTTSPPREVETQHRPPF